MTNCLLGKAFQRYSIFQLLLLTPPMHDRSTGLVVREQQSVRNNHILPPPSSKYNDLCNIIRRQGLAAASNQSVHDTCTIK